MAKFKFISIIFLLFIISANCEISPSVIIVGAGPAGIAAASRLLENNFTNTKILEAEGRIGGRIHSVKFGDAIVDLGAQWCHGEKNNIVYQLVKDFDLLEPTDWPQTFYHSSHEHIDENFVEELYELSHRLREKQKVDQEISLGDYVTAKYNESITERYRNDSEKLKFASEYLNVLHKEVISSEGTFSWFDSSAKSDFEVSDGNNNLNWKGRGYKTLLDVLMKTSPESEKPLFSNDKIIFNKEVRKIVWDDNVEHGASVECSDNSIYKADHVIFTPSLGVLKERYNTLFQPQLPLEKIHAIKELGIAAVGKAFLHFPQRWWPTENFSYVGLMWSEKDRMELSQEFHDLHESDQCWLLDLVEFYPAEKNPNVLEAWFAGESIPKIESLSDDKLVEGVMYVLNRFLGHKFKHITRPDSVVRFNWYSNPHFRGAYSYQTVESRKREVSGEIALSKPLTASNGKQTLLFAGEATNPIHYATVHGAVETGFREADRIINLYK